MPGWWVLWSIIAAAAALLALSNDLVLISTIYSFGLMLPLWFIAANLWWVMALIGLWLLIRRFIGAKRASVAVLALLGAVATGFYSLRAAQIAGLPKAEAVALAQVAAKARSMDYTLRLRDAYNPFETCDALCLAALGGGDIQWLRLERFQQNGMPQMLQPVYGKTCADLGLPQMQPSGCLAAAEVTRYSVIIEARNRAECLTDQPEFPADAPCLRFVPDDGRKADLRLTISTADAAVLQAGSASLLRLTELRQLDLQDLRGAVPVDLARYAARSYTVTAAPIPLAPRMSFDNRAGGFDAPTSAVTELLPDFAAVLRDAGVAIGLAIPGVRGMVVPGQVSPLDPVELALVQSRGDDAARIWLRVDPPKPVASPPPKPRSKAEIAAAKQARRAAQDKMITDAIRQGIPGAAP